MTFTQVAEIPLGLAARIYPEGWQSWSATTWYRLTDAQHRPEHDWQHQMRFRPGTALLEDGYQAEGLLVVDPGDEGAVRVIAAADPTHEVATIRAVKQGSALVVTADGEVTVTAHADAGTALAETSQRLAAVAGAAPPRPVPRVWCTWYRYFEQITAADVRENLAALDAHALPVDVIQIDDGWSTGTGEWTRVREDFGDLAELVGTIRENGHAAGIWLAPFLVGAESSVAAEHPDWLVGPAGHNWGQDQIGLDVTHPGVQEYLTRVLSELRDIGIEYYKLDFLYAGAVPGFRCAEVTAVEAYRQGMALIRETVGPEAYVVGCGAPILPSIGLVDAMRVAPDTFHEGAEDGSAGLRGHLSLTARSWQHGRWWINDPDCLVARPGFALREEWAQAVRRSGGLASFSDRIAELDARGQEMVRELLAAPRGADPLPGHEMCIGAPASESHA